MSTTRLALACAAATLAVAGCTADTDRSQTDPVPVSTMSTPAPQSTTEKVPTEAGPTSGAHSADAGVTVTGLRIGHHPGFDRVVYEFGGEGSPGWRVAYVDQAIQDASGKVLDVPGTSILEVQITGSAYPFDSGVEEYSGPDPLTDPSATVVSEVQLATLFEGVTQSFIGIDAAEPPFSVTVLDNPTRLVIDIAES